MKLDTFLDLQVSAAHGARQTVEALRRVMERGGVDPACIEFTTASLAESIERTQCCVPLVVNGAGLEALLAVNHKSTVRACALLSELMNARIELWAARHL